MQLDPTTHEGQKFLADHFGGSFTAEDVDIFVSDECEACLICGGLFTSKHDFEPDAYEVHGQRICTECDACGEHDPIDPVLEWGTL